MFVSEETWKQCIDKSASIDHHLVCSSQETNTEFGISCVQFEEKQFVLNKAHRKLHLYTHFYIPTSAQNYTQKHTVFHRQFKAFSKVIAHYSIFTLFTHLNTLAYHVKSTSFVRQYSKQSTHTTHRNS